MLDDIDRKVEVIVEQRQAGQLDEDAPDIDSVRERQSEAVQRLAEALEVLRANTVWCAGLSDYRTHLGRETGLRDHSRDL